MRLTLKQIERMPPGIDRDALVSLWLLRFTFSKHKHGYCLTRRVWNSPAVVAAVERSVNALKESGVIREAK